MDRNANDYGYGEHTFDVATREGGVDRNIISKKRRCRQRVATREGGVDRNCNHA